MTDKRKDVIDSLIQDLLPVSAAPPIQSTVFWWFALSALYLVLVTTLTGSLRSNALDQLASEPRFLFESILGLMAIIATSAVVFYSAVPGALQRKYVWLAAGLLLAWWANYVVGLVHPALEPSMLGKRDHCFSETLLFAIPPLAVALFLLRRLYPLQPLRSAMGAGLAAGMMPALYMQIACMYSPSHILQMHIAPGLVVALIGAVPLLAMKALASK
jgi:hypothetical protein